MKYAWVENNHIRDIAPDTPSEIYTPEVAANYTTEVPDHIENGARLVNEVWTNLEVSTPVSIRLISASDVRSKLSLVEKSKWDSESTAEIKTAKLEFASSLEITIAKEILDFLVQTNNISQESANKILGVTN